MAAAFPLVDGMACGSHSTLLSSIVLPALLELSRCFHRAQSRPGDRPSSKPLGCIYAAQHLHSTSTVRCLLSMRWMAGLGHATCCLRHRPPPTADKQDERAIPVHPSEVSNAGLVAISAGNRHAASCGWQRDGGW